MDHRDPRRPRYIQRPNRSLDHGLREPRRPGRRLVPVAVRMDVVVLEIQENECSAGGIDLEAAHPPDAAISIGNAPAVLSTKTTRPNSGDPRAEKDPPGPGSRGA